MRRLIVLTGLLAWLVAPAHADGLKVVASIKPLHSLATAVMAGAGEPTLVVSGNASEHIYNLRPSEARAIADADLVVWAGPSIESFLVRPLASLRADQVLTLTDLPAMTRLPFRVGGPFEAHDHGHEGEHDDAHEHDDGHDHEHEDEHDHDHDHEGMFDGHVWLDPQNAIVIARTLAAALGEKDPGNAALYNANAAALIARLKALDTALASSLAPVETKPFIVFHDAYQYLEHRYGLDVVGSVTVSPDVPASAKRVAALKAKIVDAGAVCIFSEPQFDPKLIMSLKEGTGVRAGVLDPLGAALPEGPDQYFLLMQGLSDALNACLNP